MSCDDALDLVPEVLSAAPALALLEHVRACQACAEEADLTAQTLAALRQGAPAAPALGADFAERVLAALPPTDGAAQPSAAAATSSVPGGDLRGRRWLAPAAVAAAWAFALGAGLGALAAGPRAAPTDAASAEPHPARPADTERGPRPAGAGAPALGPADALPADALEAGSAREPGDAPRAEAGDGAPEGGLDGGPIVVAAAPGDQAAPGAAWTAWPATRAAPLARYVAEAGLVLEAVHVLDEPDPRALAVLARHVREAALVDQGERLLLAFGLAPGEDDARLRPLIAGTQVVLRKVQHAVGDGRGAGQAGDGAARATFAALRREVDQTGLLEAYRSLLAQEPGWPATEPGAPAEGGGPL